MGNSSSSSVRQIIDTKNINKSTLDSLNEQITQSMTQSIADAQSEAGAGIVQEGEQHIGPIIARGGAKLKNIEFKIDQNTAINLSSNNKTIQDTSISTDLAMAIINNVTSKVSNDNMAKLISESESSQQLGALSATGGNSVSSDVNSQISTLNFTESQRKFSNIVANKISQESKNLTFNKCITNSLQHAVQTGAGIIAEDKGSEVTDFKMNISQSASVVQDCVFNVLQSSNITEKIVNTFGITVNDDTENKNKDEGEGKSKTSQLIKGLEDIISSLLALFSMPLLITIIVICLVCVAISCISSVFAIMSKSGSTPTQTNIDEPDDEKP